MIYNFLILFKLIKNVIAFAFLKYWLASFIYKIIYVLNFKILA